jgi:DNA replication factor GINS
MDLDELRAVQTKERQKDSLQHLRDSFYEDVAAYIQDLKEQRQEAADAASDPFADPEVSQLTDEIETAEDVVEAVYERRVGKVVKLASFAAADMPVDEEGLTVQERDLFEDLVGRINENKDRVLDILAGEGDTGPAGGPAGAAPIGPAPGTEPEAAEPTEPRGPEAIAGGPGDESDTDETPSAASETPSRSEPAVGTADTGAETGANTDEPAAPPEEAPPDAPPQEPPEELLGEEPVPGDDPTPDTTPVAHEEPPEGEPESLGRPDGGTATAEEPRTTVRITADVGRLLGMDDREYDLRSEDVVSLPEDNADALLQREAAEEL